MEIISEPKIRGCICIVYIWGVRCHTAFFWHSLLLPFRVVPAEKSLLYLELRNFYFDMAFRGTESPMDFEWQGHGPIDPSSPFHKHMMDAQAKKRMLDCAVAEVLC